MRRKIGHWIPGSMDLWLDGSIDVSMDGQMDGYRAVISSLLVSLVSKAAHFFGTK